MVRDRRWVGERVERLNAGLRDGIRVTAPRDRADAESREWRSCAERVPQDQRADPAPLPAGGIRAESTAERLDRVRQRGRDLPFVPRLPETADEMAHRSGAERGPWQGLSEATPQRPLPAGGSVRP